MAGDFDFDLVMQRAQDGRPPTEESVARDGRMERVTAAIMAGAVRYNAADVFDAYATLNELTGRARLELAKVDFLLVPTAVHHYTVAGEPPALGCSVFMSPKPQPTQLQLSLP